jgi:hypothetical protein
VVNDLLPRPDIFLRNRLVAVSIENVGRNETFQMFGNSLKHTNDFIPSQNVLTFFNPLRRISQQWLHAEKRKLLGIQSKNLNAKNVFSL